MRDEGGREGGGGGKEEEENHDAREEALGELAVLVDKVELEVATALAINERRGGGLRDERAREGAEMEKERDGDGWMDGREEKEEEDHEQGVEGDAAEPARDAEDAGSDAAEHGREGATGRGSIEGREGK